ncbi:MAG: histidine kinase [Ferruginibacter sp.]|nr:histidine kinase [Ferruginibacter sp.]
MNQQRSLILFLLLLPASFLSGQDLYENNFVRYSTAEGLSHNTVTGLAQDHTGYIWLATASGLNRYDGNRFVQFHSNNDSLSLPAEELAGMAWLDQHRLAIYATGLHIINTQTGETRNLFIPYHDRQYQYKFNMVERAMGDDKGNIFILSRSGFYHYDKTYQLVSRFDYYSEEEVPVTHFFFGRELFELDSRRLLIVSIEGLYLYDKEKKQIKKMDAADCPALAGFLHYPGTYYTFLQQKPGHFFILKSESDSLFYINVIENKKVVSRLPFIPGKLEFHFRSRLIPVSNTLLYITGHSSGFYKMRFYPQSGIIKFYPEKYCRSYLCNAMLNDKDNNLWIATNKGLLRHDPGNRQVQVAVLPVGIVDSFPNIRFDDIAVSADKIYAGTRGFGGVLLFDKKTFHFEKQILEKYNQNSNSISAIVPADSSTLLLGTAGPLWLLDLAGKRKKKILPPGWNERGDWTSDLYKDSKGNIWISAYHIYRYNPIAKSFALIPTHQRLLSAPFALSEDKSGHMWMAGHGLARYNTVLDSFDVFLDSFPYIKMPDKQVSAFVIDQQNRIWFNSNNNGLTAYDIDRRSFRHFTRSEGLPDENIASMIIVGHKLWIAYYSGIACIDLQTFQIVSFGKEDGFPVMPVVKGARFFYDNALQQLYLGFSNAIVRFNPYDILQVKSPPHVFIESLVINGQKNIFLPEQHITTSWRDNEIMITIGSISFSSGHSQGFAYRILKNETTPWQQLGSQPLFSISSLSSGTHRIQVKSFSLNNHWPPQIKEITITILPPFWKKEWFGVLITLLGLMLVYLLIRWRTGAARKNEMEKTHIQQLKADDYKNQFELEQISNYFSSSLAGKKTEEEVLWDVTDNLIGRMNYVDCMIYLWNEDNTKMIQKAAYGPKGKPEYIKAQVFDVFPGQGIVGHVLQSCQPILVNDTRTDSRYRMDEAFRLSEICVPIIHNNELLGIIDSEHHLPGYFTERDIKILTTIATLIGNKLKQIESEQSLEAKRKELEGTNQQLAEAKLSALQAQMNPHFIFNALNSIKRMILDGENEKASRYLSKFASMIRMTLNHSKDTFVTLDENLQYLKAYLEMEQLRFDNSFEWSISTGENIDAEETAFPSLMIQPLVENAIWHGLMQVEGDKKIQIGFARYHNRITCTIEDNGIGIRQSEKLKKTNKPPHQSMGLENLYKRIKILNEKYGIDCRLAVTDLQQDDENKRGTLVLLSFNIICK